MAKAVNYATDGAETVPWRDYWAYGVLLVALVIVGALRLVGVLEWSWWLVLMPLWLTFATYIASFVAAVSHRDP